VKKEDYVRPYYEPMKRRRRYGVYFIFKSMEQGSSFRSSAPQFPSEAPDYRILRRQRSRFTHYYFYIRDEVLGPMVVCVSSFLPFQTTYYLNGHHFIWWWVPSFRRKTVPPSRYAVTIPSTRSSTA